MRTLQQAIVLAISASFLVSAGTSAGDLTGYGIDDPATGNDSPSCDGMGEGYWIDRAFDTKCFARQVICDANNAVTDTRECPDNQVYIADGQSATCFDVDSSDAQDACGVTVMCDETEMTVHVTDKAIWDQTAAALQFGVADENGSCDIQHGTSSYEASLSLLTSGSGLKWDDCGGSRSIVELEGQLAVKYTFQVRRSFDRTARVEETHGAVVTREKCFMMEAECYYKADGTASSSYKPTAADALSKTDQDTLTFELYPVTCGGSVKQDPVSVEVTTEVCFAAEITSNWHQAIRMSITNCWAEPNAADAPETTKYQLSPINGGTNDATFKWDCFDGAYKEKFRFEAFRFQRATNDTWDDADINDPDQYAQTIHIKCEVNACAATDLSSADCTLPVDENANTCDDPNAGSSRRRRAASDDMSMLSKFTKGTTMSKLYVTQPYSGPTVTYTTRYNLLSDTLSMAMFATGCIFAVVALGLLIVMKRAKNQMKYRVLNAE